MRLCLCLPIWALLGGESKGTVNGAESCGAAQPMSLGNGMLFFFLKLIPPGMREFISDILMGKVILLQDI